jgi:hypothetical protein
MILQSSKHIRWHLTVLGSVLLLSNLLSAQPFVPVDMGTTVNGFQDDFDGSVLGLNWMVGGANVFSLTNGHLHVSPADGDPNHLLYEQPGYDTTTQEVLVRMRVNNFSTGQYARGGVGVGVDAASSQGINFTFRDYDDGGQTGKHMAFLNDFVAWGPGEAFSWQTNVWYWIRLRQEPNAVSQGGVNDVFAKIWPADGTVPEPADWQLTWNYTPETAARNGYAGIMAGSEALSLGARSEFDVDYILIKATGLPAIVVAPGAFVPVPVAITNQPQSQTVEELFSAAFSAGVSGIPQPTLQWYRNGLAVPGATNATFELPITSLTDNGALFKLIACNTISNTTYWATSSVASLTVSADTIPPELVGAESLGLTEIRIELSERITPATATNSSNYSLSGPNGSVAILNASLAADQSNVFLAVSSMTQGAIHTLTVNGLTDQSAAGNVIAPDSQTTFIPTSYQFCDIGNPVPPSTVDVTTNGYTITAGGQDIGGSADQFHFSFQLLSGDFDMNVRVESLALSDAWARAGLMARETTNADSRFASVLATPSIVGTFFLSRTDTGGEATPAGSFPVNYPYTWLRLKRTGDVFDGFASVDGQHWTQLGSATLDLPDTLYFGMAVASHSSTLTTTAGFADLGATLAVVPGSLVSPFEPLAASSRRTGLVISEIMYHPPTRPDGKNLEFVELFNASAFSEDISGYQLSGDINFVFPKNTLLPAGKFLVVAGSPADLQSMYGLSGIMGPYTNSLPNDSGTLRLSNEHDALLLEIKYDTQAPWPVAADGAGHSLVLAHASYGEGDPRAWDISDCVGGSPGTLDAYRPSPLRSLSINEVLANPGAGEDFIELYNHSSQANDLSGCILTDDASTNKFLIPAGTTIPPHGFKVFMRTQLGFGLKSGGDTVYLKNPDSSRVLDAVRFGPQATGIPFGRWPDGANQMYPLASPTPDAANANILVGDVVLNELMYHPLSEDDNDQFVELFNQGTQPVDVSGWKFVSGIDFTVPAGTILQSNGYLVVAKSLANLFSKYTNLSTANAVGNFSGSLAHGGERVALARPQIYVTTDTGGGNVTNTLYVTVDEVTYSDGGQWGNWSDGGGSSLELTDPRSNHRLASNWADSDETAKAPWTLIQNTGVLDLGMPGWDATAFQALLFDDGECLLDNIEVLNGANNLVANGTFESGANGWLFEGNHERTSLETNGFDSARSLHLRASGGGDSYANRVRTPLTGTIDSGSTATLRAQARWLKGRPEVLLRLRGNWLEATGPLTVPPNLGTPGLRNSRALTNAGPAIFDVRHTPVLPAANEPVVVTACVQDFDGVGSVQLKYRIDPSTVFSSVTMTDDGTGGDAVAGDGIFSATIPGQPSGTLAVFYLEATDNGSPAAVSAFPGDGPARGCLVRFGEIQPFGSFTSYRLWLTQDTLDRWINRRKTSDEPLDCTLVVGNQRVIYNVGACFSGSPWKAALGILDSPIGNMCDYSLHLPKDSALLGATSLRIAFPGNVDADNRGIDQTAQVEPDSYYIARRLGIRTGTFRHIHFFVNGVRRGSIMYDSQIPDRDMVEEWFPDNATGDLFEGSFWFEADSLDTEGSSYDDSFATMTDFTTTGGAKKLARYRWNFQRHGIGGSPNNYTNWFALVDALNAQTNYTDGVETLVDADDWMRVFAYEHLVNNWEAFGYSHGVNMFPCKVANGRWTLFPNDVDISFRDSSSGDFFYVDDPVLQRMTENPPFRRAYWRALQDAVNGPMQDAEINPLLDSRYDALVANGISVSPPDGIKSYIASVRSQVLAQLAAVNSSFGVNGPNNFTAANNPVALNGTAPVEVSVITLNGSPATVVWTSITDWTLSASVIPGTNTITVIGLNDAGEPVAGASSVLTINYTGTNPPVQPKVSINEWMASNTGFIRDPADNKTDDWFELFNPTDAAVDLTGWFLSDFTGNPLQYSVPAGYSVPAHGYLLVWADGTPAQNSPSRPDLHVNFKLDKAGEAIVLSMPNGTIMDSLSFGQQTNNVSQGRFPDGGTNIYFFAIPTPRTANIFIPPPPTFGSIHLTGTNVTLHFSGTAGFNYEIDFKDRLSDPLWKPLGASGKISGPDTVISDLVITNSQRFFRVILYP